MGVSFEHCESCGVQYCSDMGGRRCETCGEEFCDNCCCDMISYGCCEDGVYYCSEGCDPYDPVQPTPSDSDLLDFLLEKRSKADLIEEYNKTHNKKVVKELVCGECDCVAALCTKFRENRGGENDRIGFCCICMEEDGMDPKDFCSLCKKKKKKKKQKTV
jgi:hypothetical protein